MGSQPSLLSASRGAALLGFSKWTTRVEVFFKIMEELKPGFCEANNFTKPERKESMIFDIGHAFEYAIIKLAADAQDCNIIDPEGFYTDKKQEYITTHIDGKYESTSRLHEGKTAYIAAYRNNWGEDSVPVDYQIQVQHQMMCTGAGEAIVSVLILPIRQDDFLEIPDEQTAIEFAQVFKKLGLFKQYVVKRNEEQVTFMRAAYKKLWEENILKETPPEPANYDDIKKLFTAAKGTVIASDEIVMLADEYKQIKKEEAQMKKRKDEIKTQIVKFGVNEGLKTGFNIDDESAEKLVIVDQRGFRLHSYNGKRFS